MTTFKNNAKYAELLFTYLDIAVRRDCPITPQQVLSLFEWRFKGGDMKKVAEGTRLCPETSGSVFPDGLSSEIAQEWPNGPQARALAAILRERRDTTQLRLRGMLARLSTFQMLTSSYGRGLCCRRIYSGMRAIYMMFGEVWDWARTYREDSEWSSLKEYTRELMVGASAVSRAHVPSVCSVGVRHWAMLEQTRAPGLLRAVRQIKELIRMLGGPQARRLSREEGLRERRRWGDVVGTEAMGEAKLSDQQERTKYLRCPVGPMTVLVSYNTALWGTGPVRYALGKSDVERLHQLVMSTASLLVGVCAQAAVGTDRQRAVSVQAVVITEENVARVVRSSRLVRLGDEVLVCKGYRRAYTAHLGHLAGPMCRVETEQLVREAVETAPLGVLDVEGFLSDLKSLDAASSLNAAKVFKICPAPDVSPGGAMLDRIQQIGNCNQMDPSYQQPFKTELRSQILRAYLRKRKGRLELRNPAVRPIWYPDYMRGDYDLVPSDEIHQFLKWEGDAEMPDVCPYDPANWKDSGLGADTQQEAMANRRKDYKANMITRLVFDSDCPMPGKVALNPEHTIKFFIKAEGHKDPARGIFSANLTDRQAQSWMERAVDQVAREHPSYMIGQEIDARQAKLAQLTARPKEYGWLALYYSFDISGWSAKMPGEPQRISHSLWGELYGGHLFEKAAQINEGAYIYLNMEGYKAWFLNTHSNLEGFNGKEMTMILVTLLSLSVKNWRRKVVEKGVMTEKASKGVSALLFAYIDDGLSRIDLPASCAMAAFEVYKETVIETFQSCGFSVEVSKCFPSDRFSIFLNEVYIAGRHVVHGVRAAMGISSEPTERHTSLVERVSSVSTGCRGAVMAGLDPLSSVILMAYHVYLHLEEWVTERDPVVLAGWSLAPRAWGGLGLPNLMQLFISGSGSAFEEGISTLQVYAQLNKAVAKVFVRLVKRGLVERDAIGIITAPLSGKVQGGYMVDSRVSVEVRRALQDHMAEGRLSSYAYRLLKYADTDAFVSYAEAIIPRVPGEVLQEQMLVNLSEAHPHVVFSSFARRLEKSTTVMRIVGWDRFAQIVNSNRQEAQASVLLFRERMY